MDKMMKFRCEKIAGYSFGKGKTQIYGLIIDEQWALLFGLQPALIKVEYFFVWPPKSLDAIVQSWQMKVYRNPRT